ncbi:hypothetical protein SEA_ROOTS515_172 [Mycobacterium phage Roots515]|nr:hypothetical protein SEA_ROOTS515_172 [Mycobacterium phage Roots515]
MPSGYDADALPGELQQQMGDSSAPVPTVLVRHQDHDERMTGIEPA